MKYIPNIIEVQSKSVKSDRHVKKPNSLASVYKSVLAKVTCNHNATKIMALKHNQEKERATII